MKRTTCTVAALIAAGISVVLTIGFFLNQSSSGDWFEETGFLLNMATSCSTLGLVLAARIRREPYWLANVMSIILAAPSLWLSAKFIKAVLSLATHGDM